MVERISSLDSGYQAGDLSLFPFAKDSKYQLYDAKNNATTTLKQTLTYKSKYIVVDDNSDFPSNGLIRIGPAPGKAGEAELIYYDQKVSGVFRNLIRGFAGSRRNQWAAGSYVSNAVMSEHFMSIRDAVLNIEQNLGTKTFPNEETLNWILQQQEFRFMAPKPVFRAYPLRGAPSLRVRFQSFTTGDPVRFLWDFGDGTTSVERHPIHSYRNEGIYTVSLSVITSLGAHGVATKSNYIIVDEEEKPPFFYVTPQEGYSVQTALQRTAAGNPTSATEFTFVDQTDGDLSQRYWIFDGSGETTEDVESLMQENNSLAIFDPNIHTAKYTYDKPGEYEPSLLILFSNQKLKRVFLKDKITVL